MNVEDVTEKVAVEEGGLVKKVKGNLVILSLSL